MKNYTFSNREIGAYCESLSAILEGGISCEEAVIMMCDNNDKETNEIAQVINDNFTFSLTDSLKKAGVFPDYMVNMTEAGETSGKLSDVLGGLSSYFTNMDEAEVMVKKSILYPTVALFVLSGLVLLMAVKVLPIFSSVYDSLAGEMAVENRLYVNFAVISSWVIFSLTALSAVLMAAFEIMWRRVSLRPRLTNIVRKIPMVSRCIKERELASFTSLYSTYISGAVETETAFENSIIAATDKELLQKLTECQAKISAGSSFPEAAYKTNLYISAYGRILLAGEKTGREAEELEYIAQKQWQLSREKLEEVTGSIEPILSAVITASVGVILVSVMLPLIGILNSIG